MEGLTPMGRKPLFLISILVMLTAFASGCATPSPYSSGRKGFFADLQGRGSPASRRAQALESNREVDAATRQLSSRWVWPLRSLVVTSPYGSRSGGPHEGVDLRAPVGTPVYAVDQGQVLYSGRKIAGYGNLVILRHPTGLSTVYAHNSKLLVKKGQRVKRGQLIAKAGKSGRSSGPHLHFEVRRGTQALDPMAMLAQSSGSPSRTIASKKNKSKVLAARVAKERGSP